MISDSTTIVKFETLANNAASRLNELLLIIEDLTLAPKNPPTGFDFDFIKLFEEKYTSEAPDFMAAKQYYYFFGLMQRFCHTLFYNTKESVASQKLISTHLITYLLAFDMHPLAYQNFFLNTKIGQNILHFCLIAFNQSNLWLNFMPRLIDSPYYVGLNFCKNLLTQSSHNEDIPLIYQEEEKSTSTSNQFSYATKALISYVIQAKFTVMPSTLRVTPENIHAGAECYHRCFTLLTRGAELSRNFCYVSFLIPLINKYRREIVFNFHMGYREEAFVNDPRFIPALRNLAIYILQTMQPAEWLKLTLTEVTSIADIFTLKKHHTFDEAAQLYALIDPLILTLCRHKLFTRAYELMDTFVAILSLMVFKPEDKKLANAKLAPLAFMSKFHNIFIDATYQLPEFSEPEKELFALMPGTPPPKHYANVLSPLAEASFGAMINIDPFAVNDIRRCIIVMRFIKLALPLFSNPTPLKSKITQLQEAMTRTFFDLLMKKNFSEALVGYQSMMQLPNCVEHIHYFKLEPIWPAIIKICQAIQIALQNQKPINIDTFKTEIKYLEKPFTKNSDLSKKLDALFVSLLTELSEQRISDDISPQEHRELINLLDIFKPQLSAQSYARLSKQFKVKAYTDNLAQRLFPPEKINKPVTATINNKILIPDGIYQSLLTLVTAINYPLVLTGAAVFELLHQKTPHDYDVLVFGPNMDDLTSRLNKSGINFSRMGKTVEIIQIKLSTGEIIELSAIEAQNTDPDALTLLEQQQFNKRDLRLSSLFVLIKNDNTSHVITSFNNALEDAQNKRLNMVGDAAVILKQDPVRVFRVLKWLLKDTAMSMGPSLKLKINKLSSEWRLVFEAAQKNNPGNKSRLTKGLTTVLSRAPSFTHGLKLLHQYGLLSALCGIEAEQTNRLIALFETDTFTDINIERQWLYFASLSIKLFHETHKTVDTPVMKLFFWRYQEFYYLNFMQDTLMEVNPPRATIFDETFLSLLNRATTVRECSAQVCDTQKSGVNITSV